MEIIKLLEELYKAGGEKIEFIIYNSDGEAVEQLNEFTCDNHIVYRCKDTNGNYTDTVVLGLMRKKDA